ncbi:PREDICTED: transcription factor bHLH36 [Tarenaya hassleriana]|uniref:transcription factor bHLH36 n=1 Tax=Tarenaya hassleriana TaxID=28532 RepID=UPI00053C3A5C|nr:PREDICTED: transcription factor bHLH36 [Tarenaya hassleriana]
MSDSDPQKITRSCKKLRPGGSEDNREKMIHRELERQRRQEMASLYATLRSLLPLHFIKGKRSTSDQVNEAVNYIKHLQRNISELSSKRDELTLLSGGFESEEANNKSEGSRDSDVVEVHRSLSGVEISISSRCVQPRLSDFLQVVHEQGLCVHSCMSSKVDDRWIHTIQIEVDDPARIDITDLQDRLTQIM